MATPIPTNTAWVTAWSAAAATRGRVARVRGEGAVARGITSDSRAVVPGGAFVALRGERHDGHDHVDEAVRAGAVLVVVEKGRGGTAAGVDVVEVDDTLVAWGDLARAHVRAWRRRRDDARIFAITGSAGKTTTKELCAALLQAAGARQATHATTGNLNNRVGVPAVAFGLQANHRFAVFELGMSVKGEIATLAGIVEPDLAILTNVGGAHAAGVGGTRADVAREKGDLFAALSETGVAVACFDDGAAMGQLARTRARRGRTFGTGDDADYRLVERTEIGEDGARVHIRRRRELTEVHVWLPLLGEAAAVDLAGALAAVESAVGPLGEDVIGDALRSHRFKRPETGGRMQVRRFVDGTLVLDDTYNANPESVRAALRTLGELAAVAPGRRAVAIVGEMRELGPSAPGDHASLGDAIADAGVSLAVSCGGLADLAVQAAERRGVSAVRAADVTEAARVAVAQIAAGDVVLVKASRSVGAERIVEALAQARGGEVVAPPSRPSLLPSPPPSERR